MGQRKKMKLWQMLAIVILSAVLLITMFLPAFHINGNAMAKMYNKIMGSNQMTNIVGSMADVDIDEMKKEFDESIQEVEEEYGIKVSSISPGRIMTHSFEKFFGVDSSEDDYEVIEPMKSGYNTMKTMLWIIYMLAIIVILVAVLSYCLNLTKYIALAVSTVYGIIAGIAFGIFQFMVPGMLAKKVGAEELMGTFGLQSLTGEVTSIIAKLISSFWGISFLMAFIVAVLLVIVSVVSMFVGNASGQVYTPPVPTPRPIPVPEPAPQPAPRPAPQPAPRPVPQPVPQPAPIPVPAAPAMGIVKCTKGVSAGQGFSLPEDRKVVVGKSRQNANLLISYPHVSNIHCSIRYRAANNSYIVKDHSTNGTFVNGVRLQKDVPMEFPAGTVLQLADGSNEITLG